MTGTTATAMRDLTIENDVSHVLTEQESESVRGGSYGQTPTEGQFQQSSHKIRVFCIPGIGCGIVP